MKSQVLAILFCFSYPSFAQEKSFYFLVGEWFLGLDGRSYEKLEKKHEEQVKENQLKTKSCSDDASRSLKNIHDVYKKFEGCTVREEETIKVYAEYSDSSRKTGEVMIDSCNLDFDGKPLKGIKKPSKLFMATEQGTAALVFESIKRVDYEVCESKIPRDLWLYKSNFAPESKVRLIVESDNTKITEIKSSELSKGQIAEIDYSEIDRLSPKRHEVSNEILKSKDLYKDCDLKKWNGIKIVTCEEFADILVGNKIMFTSETGGYGIPGIDLVAKVNIGSRTYYYIKAQSKGGSGYILVPEFGNAVIPFDCDLPTMC